MKITTLSQNVQGLNNQAKVDLVQDYFRRHLRETEIICFQELKLRGVKFQALHKLMWAGATFFGQEAQVAYNNDANEDGAGSGGIGMWVTPSMSHLIHSDGHSRGGNVQWVRFTGVPGQDISVLNIYAPHSSTERCALWGELLEVLPRDCRWILAGDWNFVERRVDKSSSRASSVTEIERRVFQELKEALQVEDSFPASSRLRYTWDSQHRDRSRVLARLDRIYTPTPS